MAVIGAGSPDLPSDTYRCHPPHQHNLVSLSKHHTLVVHFGLHSIVVYYYATLASALKEVNKDLHLQLHMVQIGRHVPM